jgi:gliding motility-associated-like protein
MLSANASTVNCTYQWVPVLGLSDPNISNPEATVKQSFQYIVVVNDTITGCNNNAIVPIDVEDLPDVFPTPDTIRVAPGGQQLLMANEGYSSYSWTPQTYLDNPEIGWPTVFPIEDIVYFVTGISPAGCIVTDTVVINMANLMIPSGFTPNGDGVNDVWEIDNADDFPGIFIEIYNRWGQKVFLQAGYSRATAFDGTRNGKDLPIGTYYYVIYLTDKNPLTGTVTIVR